MLFPKCSLATRPSALLALVVGCLAAVPAAALAVAPSRGAVAWALATSDASVVSGTHRTADLASNVITEVKSQGVEWVVWLENKNTCKVSVELKIQVREAGENRTYHKSERVRASERIPVGVYSSIGGNGIPVATIQRVTKADSHESTLLADECDEPSWSSTDHYTGYHKPCVYCSSVDHYTDYHKPCRYCRSTDHYTGHHKPCAHCSSSDHYTGFHKPCVHCRSTDHYTNAHKPCIYD